MTLKVHPKSVEPDYIEGTNTPINLLGVTELATLTSKEADITHLRAAEILINPEKIEPFTFGFDHLRAIHYHLFQDIYEWAGKPRSYDMAKSGNAFTPANELLKYESTVFAPSLELIQLITKKSHPSRAKAVKILSKSLGLINQFHPFPEGNGRTQRIFISSLAYELDYKVDWADVKNWEMIEVCKRIHEGDYQPVETMIERILHTM